MIRRGGGAALENFPIAAAGPPGVPHLMAVASLDLLPCPSAVREDALTLLYRRAPARLRDALVVEALAEEEAGRVDLSGLWIARRKGRIVGVLLTQVLAGRVAALWAPEVEVIWGRAALAEGLVRAALSSLRASGVRLAQALLDDASPPRAAVDLTRGGLPRVTDLVYLGRDTAEPPDPGPLAPRLRWRPYDADAAGEFADALRTTYVGSLDMPELEGVRSLDDVLEGHRTSGRFDPSRWLLGRLPGEPGAAAVLLLSAVPDREAWEVTYLGLTPEARGRGLGREAVAHALALARPHVARLELAVDVRNPPAERLYRASGFLPFERRAVHLALLDGPGA